MMKILSGIPLFLVSFLAYAIEDVAAPPPVNEHPSPMGLILFAIIFFGMIGGFFFYMWRNEQKRKEQEGSGK